MSDPRYRNGIFTNTRAINRERKLTEDLAFVRNHPFSHGWSFAYRNEKLGNQPVFTQGNAKLMYHPGYDSWFYSINDGDAQSIEGTMEEITEYVKKELAK